MLLSAVLAAGMWSGCHRSAEEVGPQSRAAEESADSEQTEPVARASLEELTWMVGYWSSEGDETRAEEVWLPARGGVMVGMHVDEFASGRSFFEYLRIESHGDSLVYLASPRGRLATVFTASAVAYRRIVFSNPSHDFPQHISYELKGLDSLRAEVWGVEGGRERRSGWVWGRGPLPLD